MRITIAQSARLQYAVVFKKYHKLIFHMKIIILLSLLMLSLAKFESFNPEGPSQKYKKFVSHPVKKSAKWGDDIKFPYPTNSWFQNFVLGSNTSPVNMYSVMVAQKADCLKIGKESSNNRQIVNERFISVIYIEDWSFGTKEGLKGSKVAFHNELTVQLQYGSAASGVMFPLVYGMPFVTGVVSGQTPKLDTIHAIYWVKAENSEQSYMNGDVTEAAQAFTIFLNTGEYWMVSVDVPVQVKVDGQSLVFQAPIHGAVRVGCLGRTDLSATVRPFLATYPLKATVDYSLTETEYTMTYDYETNNAGELLMMALPHHLKLLQNPKTLPFTQKTIKGTVQAVLGTRWTLKDKLQTISWNSPHGIDQDKLESVRAALKLDANQPLPDPMEDDPYWFGLKAAKFARLVLIAEEIGEHQIAQTLRAKLQDVMIPWLTGTNGDPLYYDTTWGGVCAAKGLADSGADFGQGYYNDHHFHYGYHLYTLAVIIKGNKSFYDQYKTEILDYVQDYANPDPQDKYFTVARHKDWFVGHSWAAGLFEFYDNRNQESSSECINAYYSIQLLGKAIGNKEMELYGNLLLSTEIQSVQHYWQMPSDSDVYPEGFRNHRMIGMVWGAKVDYATWFGIQDIFIHGINMLPFIPMSEALLRKEYVAEEYPVLKQGQLLAEWDCYEISDQAIIDKEGAWKRAVQLDHFHDGSSLTNVLYWVATRP